jgi:DNA-binding GntR family transcriptional regulator
MKLDLESGFEGRERDGTKLERGARILREAILRGDLRPGQKLRQQELAESLGMSATPVREVLRILEAEGLLVRDPYRGVFVAEVSPEDTEEIAPIRVALESLAVKMCASRITDDELATLEQLAQEMEEAWQKDMDLVRVRRCNYHFHSTIYHASGSTILCGIIERLWPRFATDLLWMIPGRADSSMAQHRAILEALKQRDGDRAAELMAEHIMTAGREIVEFLKRQSWGVIPRTVSTSLTSQR